MTRRQSILFSVIMAFGMSLIMSLVMTFVNVGLVPQFVNIWLKGFAVGFIAAVPAAMMVAPIAHRIVRMILAEGPQEIQGIGDRG